MPAVPPHLPHTAHAFSPSLAMAISPILTRMNPESFELAASRRALQARCDQLHDRETLNFVIAHVPRDATMSLPYLVTEAISPEAHAAGAIVAAVAEADEFFRPLHERCEMLLPAAGQDAAIWADRLMHTGFEPAHRRAFAAIPRQVPPPATTRDGLTILPARAMRRAVIALCESAAGERQAAPASCDAADFLTCITRAAAQIERLNDPQYEPRVALLEGEPVGLAALHHVGPIGLLCDAFVVPAARRRHVGSALIADIATIARRWAIGELVTAIGVHQRSAAAWLETSGFRPVGELSVFVRENASVEVRG